MFGWICFFITLLVFAIISVRKILKRKNPYKVIHGLKLKNDKMYLDYLKWCLSTGEIPMDKYDFIKEIADKEKEINNLI